MGVLWIGCKVYLDLFISLFFFFFNCSVNTTTLLTFYMNRNAANLDKQIKPIATCKYENL